MSISEKKKSGVRFKYISVLTLLILPAAIIGFRLNLYPFSFASKLLGISLLLASITFLLSTVISLKHRNSDPSNSRQASIATFISLIPLLILGSQIVTALSLPMIHNISTDVVNPPKFDKVISIRGLESNPYSYDIESLAKVQSHAYPKIKTLIVQHSASQAYAESLRVAQSLGWDIVNEDSIKGIIEASQTSFLWGFTDDVVIRIQSQNDKAAIDLRSVSRIGRSDLGANAKRINSFFKKYMH